jgi:hypothetical protein
MTFFESCESYGESCESENLYCESENLYWDFVSKVYGLNNYNKKKYLIYNYSLIEQTRLNNTRLYLEFLIEFKLKEEFEHNLHLYFDDNEDDDEFHIPSAISYSTTQGKKFYYDLIYKDDRIIKYFENMEYGQGQRHHLIWKYQIYVLELMSNKIKNFFRTIKNRKLNKAARVIQSKFLDWFYKPICKDGTFGLSCLLAKKICVG